MVDQAFYSLYLLNEMKLVSPSFKFETEYKYLYLVSSKPIN